jgi:hypothetical protein
MNDDEKLLAEYKEAVADIRLHSGLMFGELTVYLGASGILLQIAFKQDIPDIHIPIGAVGVVLSIAFYVLHERFGDFVHAARRRAKEIESKLGFALYSSSPPPRKCLYSSIVTAINAARSVFITGLAGWVLEMVCH